MSARRFWIVAALLSAMLGLAAVTAVTNLRMIAEPALVEVTVPSAAVRIDGELVRGEVRDGLPAYVRHWDGQPPSAILIDAARGTVLAAAVFSEESFAQQRNAVRFTGGRVIFTLDARRWPAGGTPLILRIEAVQPGTRYNIAAASVLAFGFLLLLWVALWRYSVCPIAGRKALRRRLAESALFILIAFGVFATRYPGIPVRVAEVTDEGTLDSFAAALDHPERFTRDTLLADPSQFAWYTPLYLNAVRTTKALGFHYDTTHAFIAPIVSLLLLFGLRELFTTISGNRDFGFAAAFTLGFMGEQAMPPDELWSILSPLSTMLFTALVPWVLLLAFRCAASHRRWWIPCGVAGLLLHVHPKSAPVLLGALLLAFVVASDEPMIARVKGIALALAAAAITMLPYVVVYVSRYGRTVDADPAIAARALEIVRGEFANLNPWHVLIELLQYRARTLRILLDIGVIVLLRRHRFDWPLRFYLGLGAGILLVSFGVPLVDNSIASYLGRRPFQFELVRGLRFLDLLLGGGMALVVADWKGSQTRTRQLVIAASVCAIVGFGPGCYWTARAIAGRARLSWRFLRGQPDVPSRAAQESIRAVQALRTRDARVIGPMGLREFDIPVGWTWKDKGPLSYSPSGGLIACADTIARGLPLLGRPITDASLAELSTIYDAQLLFVKRDQLDATLAQSPRVLFANEVYTLVDARPDFKP